MFPTVKLTFLLILSYLFLPEFVPVKAKSIKRPRIIGGELANAGEFPWAASIRKTTSDGTYFCGGALTSHRYLLTAGQCVDGAIVFIILLGATNLQEENEYQIRVSADIYYLHPEYNPQTLENDIGIIRFREQVITNLYVRLVTQLYIPVEAGTEVRAVGWGQTSDSESGLSDHLMVVDMATISNEECKIFYGDQIKDGMICVAGQYNEGPCYGDTGGGLIVVYSNAEIGDYATLAGLSSFISGNGCESSDPAGYTRFHYYAPWIENVTEAFDFKAEG